MKKTAIVPDTVHLFILFILVAMLAFPTMTAQAATFTASTEAELVSAINNANDETNYPGADTIIITANITLGANLPQVTTQITIEGNNYTIDINNNSRMVYVNSGGNLTVNNLTVTNGNNTGAFGGGGIANNSSTLTINNCTFSNNSASANGGAIYNYNGTVTIDDSTFTDNSATTNGGAIHNNGGTVTINGSTFSNNVANGDGGAIYTTGGSCTIGSSTFADNQAPVSSTSSGRGGAIYNNDTLTVDTSTFNANYAAVNGGGIYSAASGALTVNTSLFTNNQAGYGGGLLILSGANPNTITNSTFSGNSASNDGGGLRNNSTLTIDNSTFTGNTAANGGGTYNTGTLTLNRNLVSGNTVTGSGAEINNNGGTITANNYNIISHGGLTTAQALSGFTLGANDYNASSDGNNIALASILNTTLADNGGPTQSHALVSGSPAVDSAPTTACQAGTPANGMDQRGAARSYDGDGSPGANECDSGAYEYRVPTQQCSITPGTPVTVENVTFNFSIMGTLSCVTVDEMGATHLAATGPGASGVGIQTGNWWHITGNGTGFTVAVTLPYSSADNNSRVCKYPGGLGGYGWDCDDGSNTTYTANTSVTRSGITSFSDWAVGDYVGPTMVTLADFQVQSASPLTGVLLAIVLMVAGGLAAIQLRRKSAR